MTRITLATWLVPPPAPVTVNVNGPVGAFDDRVSVRVESKFGVPEGVLKAPLTPDGNPDVVNETGELKPFSAATLTLNETIWP
jgi:hypothetical protein